MDIGYARVSTGEQTLDLQLDALTNAGCGKVFMETASGAKADRPVLAEVLSYLRAGDTLVVWRLDRLGRSLPHLIETVATLRERGIGFKSLTEQIDTTTPGGKLIFHVFGALAEFERDLIRERTHAGLAAARARGRTGGRPKKLAEPRKLALAQSLYDGGQTDITTICQTLGISRATLYRHLRRATTTSDPDRPSAGSPPLRLRRSRGGPTSEG
jgi:DNA invertase Pin-like site-specific DNA recombinase